jgi:hypothetical protein
VANQSLPVKEAEMDEKDRLLAYCGFYCGGCLGYTGVIAGPAQALLEALESYQFDRTAQCVFPEQLGEYDRFFEMLRFMTTLRCPGICRTEEPEPEPSGCEVKVCCIEQGFFACYECDGFESCQTLGTLHVGLHADACLRNLREIREMGLDTWLAEGTRHYYWMEGNDTAIRC